MNTILGNPLREIISLGSNLIIDLIITEKNFSNQKWDNDFKE